MRTPPLKMDRIGVETFSNERLEKTSPLTSPFPVRQMCHRPNDSRKSEWKQTPVSVNVPLCAGLIKSSYTI